MSGEEDSPHNAKPRPDLLRLCGPVGWAHTRDLDHIVASGERRERELRRDPPRAFPGISHASLIALALK